MADLLTTTQSDFQNLAIGSALSNSCFSETFVWDWYIRLKMQYPANTYPDPLLKNLEDVSTAFGDLWQGLTSDLQFEGQLCPDTLVDSSEAYFRLIGVSSLQPAELSKCRQILREWQKETRQKLKGTVTNFEAKFIPRKSFLNHGFEVYTSTKSEAAEPNTETQEPVQPIETKKSKKKEAFPPAGDFKKIKGSNPQEVRRQFLQHNMKDSGSASPNPNMSPSGKLRPGREVLNRMKFDSRFNTQDYVVGYIDRKAGILEQSVEEWGDVGQEELMAYIKNVKDDEIVWDKARRIDLVFGKKAD